MAAPGKILAPALALLALPLAAGARGGDELVIGMSAALSGPVESLGKSMRTGIETCFAGVNAAGGVGGRRLRLIALDDAYEPLPAEENTIRLIAEERVLAVVGSVGTPTALRTVPVVNRLRTLLLGAFSGAGVLRKDPPDRYVVNYRASYADETRAMIDALLDHGVRPNEIAFFTQDDGYGDAGYSGAVDALERRGYVHARELAHGRYPSKTVAVEEALVEILSARVPPRAIVMVGTYVPCARFIRLARQTLFDTLFLNVSFVGSVELARALGPDGESVLITQVVPHYTAALPGVQQYRADLERFAPGTPPDFVSLEGYLVARILVEAIERVPGEVDREALVDALLGLADLDLGTGAPLGLGPGQHQACHTVWPTVIRAGEVVPFDWRELEALARDAAAPPAPLSSENRR